VPQLSPAETAWIVDGVGARILAERTARGWSASECARRTGTDCNTVRRIERGLGRPSWSLLCRFAVAFSSDRPAAERLAVAFAEAAGPSLAGDPLVLASMARETVVAVLGRAARRLGLDLDDMAVRAAVVDELRAVTGEYRAEDVKAIGS
jgi:transcriptional regulator with XRE-family HTH domain